MWQPGQLLFAGFEGDRVPSELADWIAAGRVGGIVLFARNVRDPHQLRTLVADLRRRQPPEVPLTIAIDQEGGRVQRLREPWTEWPPMRALGDRGDLECTRAVAASLARELLDVGIDLDFAPVVDVDTNPANPVIGDRSFGSEPAVVCAHAAAFVEALQQAGVAACAKHFPGHGDTHTDSHWELPRLSHGLDRLRSIELAPFGAAIGAGVASVMTAHVVFEAIDRHRPATLSPSVMAILRDELGYDGLVFSDDLEMRAVADHHKPSSLVAGALAAGVDAFLVCRHIDLAREILHRLERHTKDSALEPSLARLVAFKNRFGAPPIPAGTPGPPYPEHRALADRLRSGGA
jgi:beta-N-acetylhexosaminidase